MANRETNINTSIFSFFPSELNFNLYQSHIYEKVLFFLYKYSMHLLV